MPRVYKVEKARKARPEHGIEVGDTYYHWTFYRSPMSISKTRPTKYQLTRSSFQLALYAIQDQIADMLPTDVDDAESIVQDIISDISSLRDECQDSLDSMPEALQDTSSSGELLTERIDALDEWENELSSVDFTVDEDRTLEDVVNDIQSIDFGL